MKDIAEPLIINPSLSFYNNQLCVDEKTICTLDVIGIKFGHDPIRLDMFSIGSRYRIDLKTQTDHVVMDFKSYFRISKQSQYQKFSVLLDAIWESTVVRMLGELGIRINEGESVPIGKCIIQESGISYKDFLIEWDDLTYQVNYNRLTLNSKSNSQIWTNLYFTETYNVHLLRYFLDWRFGKGNESQEVES